MNLIAKIKRLEAEAVERDKRIAALEAKPAPPAETKCPQCDGVAGHWDWCLLHPSRALQRDWRRTDELAAKQLREMSAPEPVKVTDWSGLKNAAAMHNPKAYEAGWAEIHESGQPMTDEQERRLMEMFRRVLAGPKKRKPRAKTTGTE